LWAVTVFQTALKKAVENTHLAIGGTSAGCAILGEVVFGASAEGPILTSAETLKDTYATAFVGGQQVNRVDLRAPFVNLPGLQGVVTDTHFGASGGKDPHGRNRMGRLVTFLARVKADHPANADYP